MAHAAQLEGTVICFRCRTRVASPDAHCRCEQPADKRIRYAVTTPMLGLWLAGAALAGSFLGAALALLH